MNGGKTLSASPAMSGEGLRRTGIAIAALAVAVSLWVAFVPVDAQTPSALIAIAGLTALGIVFIGVSLVAHVFESRELAVIEALLDRAEKEHAVAVRVSNWAAVELGLDDRPTDDGSAG